MQLIEALGIEPIRLQPAALVAGAIVAVVVFGIRRRTKRGSCRFCDYSLAGLEEIVVCPECGRPRSGARAWDTWAPITHIALLATSLLPPLASFVLVAIQRSVYRSHDINILSAITTDAGIWLLSTVGSFGLMLVHALFLIRLGGRRLGMRWIVPLLILAVVGNAFAYRVTLLSAVLISS